MSELVREAGWATTDASEAARRRLERVARPPLRVREVAPTLLLLGLSAGSLHLVLGFSFGLVASVALSCVAAVLFSAAIVEGAEAAARRLRAAEPPVEVVPTDGERHVAVGIWQGDALTGEDEGLLWIEDGRLYFSGVRTSFGLVPAQVRGGTRFRRGLLGDTVEIVLRRDTPAGALRLSFSLRPDVLNADYAHRTALRLDLDEWLAGPSEGEGQLPPLALGPGLKSERRLLAEAVGITVPPALFLAVLATVLTSGSFTTWLFAALAVFAGMVPAGNLRWRDLRDRRRLRGAP